MSPLTDQLPAKHMRCDSRSLDLNLPGQNLVLLKREVNLQNGVT